MKKIAVILDSGSNYQNKHDDVYVLPMQVFIKDKDGVEKSFLDDEKFERKELIEALNNKQDISTSMASPGLLLNLLEKIKDEYEHIVILPLSKYLSGFYENCKSLTKEYDNVIVIDGKCVGISGNWLAHMIIDYVNKKNTIVGLQEYVDKITEKTCGVVIVGDLTQLKKGGRISSFKSLIASAIKLKLIVKFDGQLSYVAKDLTWTGAINKSLELIDKQIKYSTRGIAHISIFNELNNESEGVKLVEYTKEALKLKVNDEPSLLPKCVIAHTGANSFSILIQAK